MASLTIDGVAPWDGEYEFDWGFTNEELHRIKVISRGIRAGEIIDALVANDSAVYVALATVVLEQHGKRPDEQEFWDAQKAAIKVNPSDTGEGDALPPEKSVGSPGAENESAEPSGATSDATGA